MELPVTVPSGIFGEVNGVLYSSHTADEVNDLYHDYRQLVKILISDYQERKGFRQQLQPHHGVKENNVKNNSDELKYRDLDHRDNNDCAHKDFMPDNSVNELKTTKENEITTETKKNIIKKEIISKTNNDPSKDLTQHSIEIISNEVYEKAYKDMKVTCNEKLREARKTIRNNKPAKNKVKKLGKKLKNAKSISKMVKVSNNFDAIIDKNKQAKMSEWITPKLCAKVAKTVQEVKTNHNKFEILQEETDDNHTDFYELKEEVFKENGSPSKYSAGKHNIAKDIVVLEDVPEVTKEVYSCKVEAEKIEGDMNDILVKSEKTSDTVALVTCEKEKIELNKVRGTLGEAVSDVKAHGLIGCERRWTLVSNAEALFRSLEDGISECCQDDLIEMKQEVEQIYLKSMGITDTVLFDTMESRFRHLNEKFLREKEIMQAKSSVENKMDDNDSNESEIEEKEISIDQPSNIDTVTETIDSEQAGPMKIEHMNWNTHATQLRQEIDTVKGMAQDLLLEIDKKLHAGRHCDRNKKRKPVHQALKKLRSMKSSMPVNLSKDQYDSDHEIINDFFRTFFRIKKSL